jgi:predicted DNA-binding transcriptional regulator YafY
VRPDLETTAALVEACSTHRVVRLRYRSEAGSEWEMEVEPWAVVVRHGRWYLLCRVRRADAVRAYRIDRVREIELLDRSFEAPTDLDAVAMLEEHLAVGWEYEAEVLIDAPVGRLRTWFPRVLGRLLAVDDSTCRLVGSTSSPAWYAQQLAVIPAPFRVVRGPEVRAAVLVLGQRLVAAAG